MLQSSPQNVARHQCLFTKFKHFTTRKRHKSTKCRRPELLRYGRQILPIKLHVNGNQINTYAFLDDGANVSMIDRDFAKTLGLHGKR